MGVDWGKALKYGAGALAGGPLGVAVAHGQIKQDEGNEAQQNAMGQAGARLAQLQKEQMERRQADLARAMSYFQPAEDFLSKAYGVKFPGAGGGGGRKFAGLTPEMSSTVMNFDTGQRKLFGDIKAPPGGGGLFSDVNTMFGAPPPPAPPGIDPWPRIAGPKAQWER